MKLKHVVLALLPGFFAIKSMAGVVYVDSAHVGGTQNGAAWATAFSNLQTGINAANAGDSVWVARGTYKTDIYTPFAMKEGVKIFGGFLNSSSLFTDRNFTANPTILKGNGNSVVANYDNNLTAAALLNGFTITEGHGSDGGGIYCYKSSPSFSDLIITGNNAVTGGGMYFGQSTSKVSNVVVTHNWSYQGGGGICNYNAFIVPVSPAGTGATFTDITVSYNVDSTAKGGGIYNYNASPSFNRTNVVGNIAAVAGNGGGIYNQSSATAVFTDLNVTGNRAYYGGGVYNDASSPIYTNAIINNNKAVGGGGVYSYQSAAVFNHVSISNDTVSGYDCFGGAIADLYSACAFKDAIICNNTADASGATEGGNGGAIYIAFSNMTVTKGAINNNTAISGSVNGGFGGAIWNNSGPSVPMFTTVTISGNKALGASGNSSLKGLGGGVYCASSSIYITNALVSGNLATGGVGGGICNISRSPTFFPVCFLTNTTIAGNRADSAGGGIQNDNVTITIRNSIIYGNGTTNTSSDGYIGQILNYSYSIVPDQLSSTGVHNLPGTTNPLFINALPPSAAPTVGGNYRVQSNSPVINAGGNSYYNSGGSVPTYLTNVVNDLAGGVRIFDTAVDMGAYEYQPPLINLGNDTSVCSASGFILDAQNTGATYLWNTGATTQTITADTSGTYIVTATNTVGSTTDSILVTAHPSPVINLGTGIGFCSGGNFILDAGNIGSTYLWNTGATTRTLDVNTTGAYSVIVTDSNQCSTMDTINVVVYPAPVVNLGNDATIADVASVTLDAGNPGSTYLWSTGATTQTIIATTPGIYSVTVTNSMPCSGADTIVLTGTVSVGGVNDAANTLNIAPNPAREMVYIQISNPALLNTKAILMDAYGRKASEVMMRNKSQQLSLAGLASGIYILKMQNGQTIKIVKE